MHNYPSTTKLLVQIVTLPDIINYNVIHPCNICNHTPFCAHLIELDDAEFLTVVKRKLIVA